MDSLRVELEHRPLPLHYAPHHLLLRQALVRHLRGFRRKTVKGTLVSVWLTQLHVNQRVSHARETNIRNGTPWA